jgi:hypothetical protein
VDASDGERAGRKRPAAADAAARLYGGPHNAFRDARTKGLPRWASVVIATAFVLGTLLAVVAYVATRSLLVAGVCLGVAYLIGLAAVSMARASRP